MSMVYNYVPAVLLTVEVQDGFIRAKANVSVPLLGSDRALPICLPPVDTTSYRQLLRAWIICGPLAASWAEDRAERGKLRERTKRGAMECHSIIAS